MDENIASNWDLYLITVLTLLLGLMIYLRRPPGPVYEAPAPPPQPEAAPFPSVPTVPVIVAATEAAVVNEPLVNNPETVEETNEGTPLISGGGGGAAAKSDSDDNAGNDEPQ